jgi:hypothetical protein
MLRPWGISFERDLFGVGKMKINDPVEPDIFG